MRAGQRQMKDDAPSHRLPAAACIVETTRRLPGILFPHFRLAGLPTIIWNLLFDPRLLLLCASGSRGFSYNPALPGQWGVSRLADLAVTQSSTP
jgi:hypothetical protein